MSILQKRGIFVGFYKNIPTFAHVCIAMLDKKAMEKRITIKDIAKALNIHHSTVSRALSDDFRIKEETKKRVKAYAEANGYVQNVNALSFREGVRNVIALIVPNVHHRFFSNVISYITDYAKSEGFIIAVFQSNESIEEEREIIMNIVQNNFAGVIASLSMETKDVSHFEKLAAYHIPLVLFDRVCDGLNVSKVVANSQETLFNVTTHLIKKGYNKICYLGGLQTLSLFQERSQGYKDAMNAAGLPFCFHEVDAEFSKETGERYTHIAMQTGSNAILCDSYNMALGVHFELKRLGYSIPKDVALVSFGNDLSASVLSPSMSLIVQPETNYAKCVFELILDSIKDFKSEKKTKQVELIFEEKESS